jgi:hypothetical protein
MTASDDSSSASTGMQAIANQFDLHNMTDEQEGELRSELVSSGAISQNDAFHMWATTTFAKFFNAQHIHLENGQMVAGNPSQPGQLIGVGSDGGSFDPIQQMQQTLASDQYFGNTQNVARDQSILNALNQLGQLRAGASS